MTVTTNGARAPSTASREFVAFWMEDGLVAAGMNVNVWGVTDAVKRLIRERVPVDEKRLADPEQPLEELAAAQAANE